jgi:hypothetical protein
MAQAPARLLILDACVLIDFCEVDVSVLGVISRALGAIHVASPVLAEVTQLDESTAISNGLRVVEPPLSIFTDAAQKRGRLSVQDHLCLLLAKAEGWTCVSNDRALRAACSAEGVAVLWGLEMMGLAVERGHLLGPDAERVAWAMRDVNPFISEDLVLAFVAKYVRARSPTRKR